MTIAKAQGGRLKLAVIGSGISGLSAAWLLSHHHDVTVYEKDTRLGGHANTVDVQMASGTVPIDTGFIVYNPKNYPNLTALFEHLNVETALSNMSFSVSMDGGAFEYGGGSFASLFAQKRNLANLKFWLMLGGLLRFYRQAPADMERMQAQSLSLGDYLAQSGYSQAFQDYHLLPMAGAIWSAPPKMLRAYPAAAFVRFFNNHGLLDLRDRPPWRTVVGGSRRYVASLSQRLQNSVRIGVAATSVSPREQSVAVSDSAGATEHYDRVLIAAHADDALNMLAEPLPIHRQVLGTFNYTRNRAVLHTDARLMPRRRATWASWNFIGQRSNPADPICVSYWMNCLQPLKSTHDFFVTLNPPFEPAAETIVRSETYAHPVFTHETLRAQKDLASMQGLQNIWFCGAYCGSGFHEDGLKSGLDAAEAIGGVKRPWALTASAAEKGLVA